MSGKINRLAVCMLWLFSFTAFPCEVKQEHGVTIYTSCTINTAPASTTKPVLLQFKFSGKGQNEVFKELEQVQRKLNMDVAAHKIPKGYRLLLGPIEPQKINYYTQQLKLQGYHSTLLREAPSASSITSQNKNPSNASVASSNIPKPPATHPVPPVSEPKPTIPTTSPEKLPVERILTKTLGDVQGNTLLAVVDPDTNLIELSYPKALKVCQAVGGPVRLAQQEEYVALLSSEYAPQLLGEDLATPFWLNEQWVISRVDEQIQKRKAADKNYRLVCSLEQ